ncbi:hypothetical protein AURDEDRAFT_186847 [Auricularia subglabra TFB-10046 SS5]|uniref:Uncharacterized protein n=1 Tax=Auricularia subglabra (strain TFB-10046 / SS5) TaxID=717982 RepID=J0D2B5_AURST|nr:hypothetical protein AURDEDRAFT_186847 [Auricularia subglabra TFB-10046 SS5]
MSAPTSAARPLVKGRQAPQGPSPDSGAQENDPLQPDGETSSSSYNYWWPYPPGGVAQVSSTPTRPAFDEQGRRITYATSATDSDAADSTTRTDLTNTYSISTASLFHITAVVPATETSASSTAPPTIVNAYKHPRSFNILWLSPLFVLVGILIGATLAGWSYGRWARRRGRVSSISASKRPDDAPGGRGSYAQLATGMRVVSGTRRVSARRYDSYEDIKLVSAADDHSVSEKMPATPPRPHFPSDDEDEPPATGSKLRFSATRTIRGWIASVRSTGSVASIARSGYSPPRDRLERLHLREAAAASYDGRSLYSVHRHATVYRASPENRGVELRDDGVKAMRRPASTIDDDYASTMTSDFQSLGSPQRTGSELEDAMPTSTGSGYTPAAARPSTKHTRIGSMATSEGTDDGDALRIRQSIMDRMQMLKDEVSVDSVYLVDSSDDEWQSQSPSRVSRARSKSMRRTLLESVQGSPAIDDSLNTIRLSAEIAREKRLSSDTPRRSLIPASAPATPGPSALLSRIKARFEQRKVEDEAEQALLSPTPSEALISSAFRDAVSPRLKPTISPLRLKSKLVHGTTLDAILRNQALDASVSSLELDASPPQSQLPLGAKDVAALSTPTVRKSVVGLPARPPAVAKTPEPATIRLTISRSSSSSVASLRGDSPSKAPTPKPVPQLSHSPAPARLSPSPSPLSTPNRIPRLQPTRPVSELPGGRSRAGSSGLRTPSPRLSSAGFVGEPQAAATPDKTSGLRRASAKRISATPEGLGGRTISVTVAAAQARRERGSSITAGRQPGKPVAIPAGKFASAGRRQDAEAQTTGAPSSRRGTIATFTGRAPVTAPTRPTRSNTAPSPKLDTPSTLRRAALGRVDDIVARSWSARDEGPKSPTNFGADVPSLTRGFPRA